MPSSVQSTVGLHTFKIMRHDIIERYLAKGGDNNIWSMLAAMNAVVEGVNTEVLQYRFHDFLLPH